MNSTESTEYLSVVHIACETGYTISPGTMYTSMTVQCGASQQWEVLEPQNSIKSIPQNCSRKHDLIHRL